MTTDIKGFFGEYRWLSNYHLCPIKWGVFTFPSTENAYQWLKIDVCALKNVHQDFNDYAALFQTCSPKDAKKYGKVVPLRDDWDLIRYTKMFAVNLVKYMDNPDLAEKLRKTGRAYLEETNTWNDTYWGVCNGVGENNLGRILMDIRTLAQCDWDPELSQRW